MAYFDWLLSVLDSKNEKIVVPIGFPCSLDNVQGPIDTSDWWNILCTEAFTRQGWSAEESHIILVMLFQHVQHKGCSI